MSIIRCRFLNLSLFIFLLTCNKNTFAQVKNLRKKVAIFTPLFLDSAFNNEGKYKFATNTFPKFLNPGIEFYEGVKLAIDSLQKEEAMLEFYVFDTKSKKKSIPSLLSSPLFDSIDLIITHCNSAEAKLFAEVGFNKNTPVINANLPSDAGAISNPFWIVLNPTLRTQCEGIYKLVQKHFSLDPIIVFRKKGTLEDRIKTYIDDFGKNTSSVKLNLTYVDFTDSIAMEDVKKYLDTNINTTCIVGSLDEGFGKKILTQLVSLYNQGYKSTIIGMPTWDALQLHKPDFKGPEVIYSNPFYNTKNDKLSKDLTATFGKTLKARPSDMVFRGYETTLRFAKLLLHFKEDFASNISNKSLKIFTDFDIQPVLNRQSLDLDYFENKNLSFLKWQDGVMKTIF
ncbi:MAG: hypothetical protein RIR12_2283 [Bacteroidota bacterium]